ncbi:hypothetical protein [Neolewinella sp.]|uniref:hypothetical protein n=1 Tax=Neolewinella sp. TaxID=2993543 RepID=UPI003B529D23
MAPADFIASCRRLQMLDLTEPVVDSVVSAVTVEMPRRYAMSLGVTTGQTFLGGGPTTRNRRGQYHELVQHLTDLGYLSLDFFRRWHLLRAADRKPSLGQLNTLTVAVGTFYREDPYWRRTLVPPFPPDAGGKLARQWLQEHLTEVVYRLGLYTSFDGDLSPDSTYRIGDRTAYGRSLAFRMRVYFHDYVGGRTGRRKVYFDRGLLPLLYSLDNSLRGGLRELLPERDASQLHPSLQRLLLDSEELFRLYRAQNRFLPEAGGGYYLLYEIVDDGPSQRLRVVASDQRRAARRLERGEWHADTGSNRLGIRLLQLGLWRAGFYTGVLDGAFGLLSHRAVLALVDQERDTERPVLRKRQLDRVVQIVDREVLVDLRLVGKLLDAYAPPSSLEVEEEEDRLWGEIEKAGWADRLDAEFNDQELELGAAYGNPHRHPHRRVYYGLRGLIRGAARAVGRVLGWLAGGIRVLLGAVFDFVKAVVKRIQEGTGLLVAGFRYFGHYLLGRPFVTLGGKGVGERPVVLTRFALDFDTVAFVDRRATGDDVRAHSTQLRRMQQGARYFIGLVSRLIRGISLITTPVSWLRLGVLLARTVRDLLREGELSRPLGRLEQV